MAMVTDVILSKALHPVVPTRHNVPPDSPPRVDGHTCDGETIASGAGSEGCKGACWDSIFWGLGTGETPTVSIVLSALSGRHKKHMKQMMYAFRKIMVRFASSPRTAGNAWNIDCALCQWYYVRS